MENYITIDSVGTYFKLRNYELLHPLIGILNFDNFNITEVGDLQDMVNASTEVSLNEDDADNDLGI